MKTTIFLWSCCFWHLSLCLLSAAEPTLLRFYDETTMRHLSLAQEGFGRTTVTVRAASDPGNSGTWVGNGDRKDKTLLFSRIVNEGEDRGTVFLAEISESKVKIDYKPGQREPMDAAINGEYRRTSEAKFLQLAKKEFQAANDRLVESLKAATKIWQASDRPALLLWKEQWPALRERWISAALPQAPATAGSKPAAPASTEKPAEHWLYLAQATTQAFYFLSYLPDPKTGLGWDGEYDDLGGGHASVRLSKDGKLRLSLSSIRPNETEARTLDATAQPDKVMTAKNGELTAEFTVMDPESKDPTKLPRIRLKKIGRYLQVETETEQAQGNAGRGWFDGIYRGSPVPEG